MRRFLAAVSLATLAACQGMKSPPPVEVCTKVGEQCRLPQQGPLGVCNSVDCAPGQTPPCLRCASQH
jgi:hypothetical protein